MQPADYRDLAARCVRMASESTDPGHRITLLEMAQRWRELADQAERVEPPDEKQ
jgi:hypothetical protein